MKISAKHRFIEPWMTRGLEISSRKKKELYKATSKKWGNTKIKIKIYRISEQIQQNKEIHAKIVLYY